MTSQLPPEELLQVIRTIQSQRRTEAHPQGQDDDRPTQGKRTHPFSWVPVWRPVRDVGIRWSPAIRG